MTRAFWERSSSAIGNGPWHVSSESVSGNSLTPLISSITISIRYSHDALVSFTVALFLCRILRIATQKRDRERPAKKLEKRLAKQLVKMLARKLA